MKNIAIGLAIALIALVPGVWGQEQDSIISEVQIEGLERVSEQVVRARLEVQSGQRYNPRAVSRDIRRLFDLGYFANVQAAVTPVGNQVVLTYIIEEKLVVQEISVTGNRRVRDRQIRSVLTTREGQPFLPENQEQDRQAIVQLYEGRGYANTVVDAVVEQVGPSRVRVYYNIEEGRKARIRSIDFVGNELLTDRALRREIDTSRAWWFLGGRYEEDRFEQDLQNLIDVYSDYGRLEVDVPRADIEYSDDGKRMDITVYINEGPEYRVNVLEFSENIVYDDDELLDTIQVQAGDLHNRGQVLRDADLIEQGYQESGYVNALITPQVTLDRDAKTTHVVHNINEGVLKYIREIDITGNEVTKDEVIRREMLISPGERFDGVSVRDSQRRIENTRYFDNVRITLDDYEGEGRFTNLLVDVEEGKTGNFNFGFGYSSEDRLGGFAELRLNNFDITNWPTFSGGGQQFAARVNVGERRDQYSLSFTDPEIFGYPLSFGADLYDESYRVRGGANYREDQRGAQLRLGKVLSPHVTVRTSMGYQSTNISELPFFVNPEIRRQRGQSTTISNYWEIERNTLDRHFDPSSGSVHTLGLQIAGLGGDNNFLKFEHDSQWFWALDEEEKWIFSFRTREGYLTEYGSSDYIPLQDRFYAGGTNTVRGFRNRDIGPSGREFIVFGDRFALGGNLRWVTNVEMKYKVTDMLRVYAFVDSAGVWADTSDFSFGDMKHGAGVGLGVDVPRIGPIRVDYGYPINPDGDQSSSGRLHMTTGFRF